MSGVNVQVESRCAACGAYSEGGFHAGLTPGRVVGVAISCPCGLTRYFEVAEVGPPVGEIGDWELGSEAPGTGEPGRGEPRPETSGLSAPT